MNETITIKRKGATLIEAIVNRGSTRFYELMGEDYISLKFSTVRSSTPLSYPPVFLIGDYCDVDGERFVVGEHYAPTYNSSTGGYDYTLQMNAEYRSWKRYLVKNAKLNEGRLIASEVTWKYTAQLHEHVKHLLVVLAMHGQYEADLSKETGLSTLDAYIDIDASYFAIDSRDKMYKLMEYDGTNIIEALDTLCSAEMYDCEWWATRYDGRYTLHFGRRQKQNTSPFVIETAVNASSITLAKTEYEYANRLYVFGGTQNVPYSYRKELVFTNDTYDETSSRVWDSHREITYDNFVRWERQMQHPINFATLNSPEELHPVGTRIFTKTIKLPTYTPGTRGTYRVSLKSSKMYIIEELNRESLSAIWHSNNYYQRDRYSISDDIGKVGVMDCVIRFVVKDSNGNTVRTFQQSRSVSAFCGIINTDHQEDVERMLAEATFDDKTKDQRVVEYEGKKYYRWTEEYLLNSGLWEDYTYDYHFVCIFDADMDIILNEGQTLIVEIEKKVTYNPDAIFLKGYRTGKKGLQEQLIYKSRKTIVGWLEKPSIVRVDYYTAPCVLVDYTTKSRHEATFEQTAYWSSVMPNDKGLKLPIGGQYMIEGLKYGTIDQSLFTPDDGKDVINGLTELRLRLPIAVPANAGSLPDALREGYAQQQQNLKLGFVEDTGENDIVEMTIVHDEIFPSMVSMNIGRVEPTTRKAELVFPDASNSVKEYPVYILHDTYVNNVPSNRFEERYILPNVTLQVKFNTGLLAGMTFDVKFDGEEQTYTIVPNQNYGMMLPNETLKPQDGDEILLIGWDVRAIDDLGMIEESENRLFAAALDDLEKYTARSKTYNVSMLSGQDNLGRQLRDSDKKRLKDSEKRNLKSNDGETLPIGHTVVLRDYSLFGHKPDGSTGESKRLRVIGFEKQLDLPWDSPKYTVGEIVRPSRLKLIEKNIKSWKK